MTGVEYPLDHPQHWDGVSEWWCEQCERRFGRWTKRELQPGESEPRYGEMAHGR